MPDDNGITVTIHTEALTRAVSEMEKRSLDQRPAWKAIAAAQETATDDTFVAEGARDGHAPWKQLSAKRLEQRREGRNTAESAMILQDTGRLRSSITSRSGRDYAAVGVTLGSGAEDYARAHQEGVPAQHLPARPFLFVSDEDLDEHAATILDYITAAFGG